MRADRLISLLMLLQRRGQITAAEAARELEVSTKTIRRDLEALSISGVPVYAQPGRGGGWRLLGGARTDLTGLSAGEARALFGAAGSHIEQTPALASAMRKLSVALPPSFRQDAEAASAALKIDRSGWGRAYGDSSNQFVGPLTDAIIAGKQIELEYSSARSELSTRMLSPLGLVAKNDVWYLLANTEKGSRTFRLSRVVSVAQTDLAADRPEDFDLDEAWAKIVDFVESHRQQLTVEAWVNDYGLRTLRWLFGQALKVLETGNETDQIRVSISASSVEVMAGQIAGFGSDLQIIDPPEELRQALLKVAKGLNELYR